MERPVDKFFINMMDTTTVVRYLVEKLNKHGNYSVSVSVVDIAKAALLVFSRETLIRGFIIGSYDFWDSIKNKNDNVIEDHSDIIFGGFSSTYVDGFKEMFKAKKEDGSLIINQKDRETIWTFLHALVKISIRYVHEMREPYSDSKGDLHYHNKFFTKEIKDKDGTREEILVDTKEMSKKWDIVKYLKFPLGELKDGKLVYTMGK